jgi:hypothetical protein
MSFTGGSEKVSCIGVATYMRVAHLIEHLSVCAGLTDRIATRLVAHDSLSSQRSTFMSDLGQVRPGRLVWSQEAQCQILGWFFDETIRMIWTKINRALVFRTFLVSRFKPLALLDNIKYQRCLYRSEVEPLGILSDSLVMCAGVGHAAPRHGPVAPAY